MKYNDNGEWKDIIVKATDTLPIGTEVDYNGTDVPDGWEEVEERLTNIYSWDETCIGEWLGKPLYRKVIPIELPEVTTDGVQGPDRMIYYDVDADYIILKEVSFMYNSDFRPLPQFVISKGGIVYGFLNNGIKAIILRGNIKSFSEMPGYAVLEYTKK